MVYQCEADFEIVYVSGCRSWLDPQNHGRMVISFHVKGFIALSKRPNVTCFHHVR
jgi:hypothetical protein